MHSSCSVHDNYLCGMYSTSVLQDVEAVCVDLTQAWYMMWEKDVFLH